MMCDKLIDEMKQLFDTDHKRIDHAMAVLRYAQQIQTVEGGDLIVVSAAAILHDIGIRAAERKYGSAAGKYQEIEGPPIAREILAKYDIPDDKLDHICRIIANHHTARHIDTIEFRIIWDSDWLVNIPADFPNATDEKLSALIGKIFKTKTGRQLATRLFRSTKLEANQ